MKINLNTIKIIFEKHGPTILSYTAMFGVAVTAYLMHRSEAKNAVDICAEYTKDNDKTYADVRKEVYKRNWKTFIPPVLSGIATMGMIFGANKWHLSKEAALASAALMYKAAGEELEKKLKEEFGEEKVEDVKKKIVEEKNKKEDTDRPPWEIDPDMKIDIWEPYTKQWISASQKEIIWAELTINKLIEQTGVASMNDVLSCFKGSRKFSKNAAKIGWNRDSEWFDYNASYAPSRGWITFCPQYDIGKDGQTIMILDYEINPSDLEEAVMQI